MALSSTAGFRGHAAADSPVVLGLSHVPVAVADLPRAAEDFRKLGFTLKPGRRHADEIQNAHAKFPDGTELELVTVTRRVDATTTAYRRYLDRGDGPAFVALYAPEMSRVARRLDERSLRYEWSDGLISLADDGPAREFFFADLNDSPTGVPRNFQHANGANGLVAVWLAGSDLSAEKRLLEGLGATETPMRLQLPSEAVTVDAMHLDRGDVCLLPQKFVMVPGHPIVGVTVRTTAVGNVLTALGAAGIAAPPIVEADGVKTLFIPPQLAHGMWIAFRESAKN